MRKIAIILFVLPILALPSFAEEAAKRTSKFDTTKTDGVVSDPTAQLAKPSAYINPNINVTLDEETRKFLAKQSDGMGIKDWVLAFIGIFGALLGAMIGGRYTRKATIEGVAVTFRNEMHKKEKADLDNQIALLQSLLEEISTLYSIFEAGSGGALITINTEAQNINERYFKNYFAASCNYFCIYDCCAEKIGSFKNKHLRSEVITIYTMSKSLVDSLLLYNKPLHDLNNWRIFNINHPNYLQIFEEHVLCLIQNTMRLQVQATELKSKVENLKIDLQEEIEGLSQKLAELH